MDYLIVGAGIFGAVFAYEAKKAGKKCLVIDKRGHIAGNVYTKESEGINVHKYGAHIFHTNNEQIWKYIKQFSEFNNFINSPIAVYKNEIYNLPFNMNTFNKMWGVMTPKEAREKIQSQICENASPQNLEEQALTLVGKDIYTKLIKGYTEKQWGREARELPAFIIKRLPIRYTYDNNYFDDKYQGIPIGGYTQIVEKMLEGIEVQLKTDYFATYKNKRCANKIIYTGMIDEYFGYQLGKLEYRSLRFEEEKLNVEDYQGNAVVNYTEREIPYTRIIEHKHFEKTNARKTIITKEYPSDWKSGEEPYYPINNKRNETIYKQYVELAKQEANVIFGGRLGSYKYYDMDKVIEAALTLVRQEIGTKF